MKNKAFTLIELLVVIVIIGILATIGVATYQMQIDTANDTKDYSECVQTLRQTFADCVASQSESCEYDPEGTCGGGVFAAGSVCGARPYNAPTGTTFLADATSETGIATASIATHCDAECPTNNHTVMNVSAVDHVVYQGYAAHVSRCETGEIFSTHACGSRSAGFYFEYGANVVTGALSFNSLDFGWISVHRGDQSAAQPAAQDLIDHCTNTCLLGTYTQLDHATNSNYLLVCD